MFLLDTNVISEMRRLRPHGAVLAWLRATDAARIFIPAVAVGELQIGIERTRRNDLPKAQGYEQWLDTLIATHRVLPMATQEFRLWAQLMHGKPQHHYVDAMIAAIALVQRLTVVTRNTADFVVFGVTLLNPFQTP